MSTKTIGILGGMGPDATIKLYEHIVRCTKAEKDQDHIPLVIYNLPSVPDRSKAILENGGDPTPYLLKGAQLLEKAGVDLWAIPCVTAHYFIEPVLQQVAVPFVSIIHSAVEYTKTYYPNKKTVGILATTGTIHTKIFENAFRAQGYETIIPSKSNQETLIMGAIFGERGIKAGYTGSENQTKMRQAANDLIKQGAEMLVAGCTEIPLVLTSNDVDVPVLDTLLILAKTLIQYVGCTVKC